MHCGQILLKARIYSFGEYYIVFGAKFADKKNSWIFLLYNMLKVQADLKV
jgi:hypothetical protein